MIAHTVVKNRIGPKTYLLKDKEAYIISTSEIYGAHVIPGYATSFENYLQQFIHDAVKRRIGNVIY